MSENKIQESPSMGAETSTVSIPKLSSIPTLKELKSAMAYLFGDDLTYSNKYKAFTRKDSYFYHGGRSTETLTQDVISEIAKFYPSIEVAIQDKGDNWANWPKTSFMWVRFSVASKKTEPEVKPITMTTGTGAHYSGYNVPCEFCDQSARTDLDLFNHQFGKHNSELRALLASQGSDLSF